jgi:predicted dithiol-disulfide oxidoreductase (DUF899 family)/DNA-binding transcriptional ArsR family regulator
LTTSMPPDAEAVAEQVFAALADPSRRTILAELASAGPATATDLAARLPITRQAIAKHLALLAEAGLVTAEPGERRRVRYRLHSAPIQVAQQFLAALARDWDGPLWALQKHLDGPARGPGTIPSHETQDIMDTSMKTPPVVTAQEWEAARQQLLVKEKELTRARDALAAQRRRMPWLTVEKDYEFDGPEGKASLLDLFEGRRQLVIYRAFFEPGVLGWPDHACHGCSMMADQVAHVIHLNARDTTFAYASRAPQPEIARLKARMGWTMPWYTVTDDWDADFGVDEYHGTNAFIRDGDQAFRTYFLNNRGDEALGSTWSYLDMTALGRQENWEDSPEGYPQSAPYNWWNWHDEYDHPELSQGRMRGWE